MSEQPPATCGIGEIYESDSGRIYRCYEVNKWTELVPKEEKDMANYEIIHDGDWLTIKDIGPHDQHKTVTNDAESVIKELAPRLNSRRLYYIDSEGNFARLLYEGDRFTGYAAK